MNDRDTPERFSQYVDRLASLTGVTPTLRDIASPDNEVGRVVAVVCVDFPGSGYVTGFTYGLSLANHPEWGASRRELSIAVRSSEIEWAIIPSRAVDALRVISSFPRGRAIGYKSRFVENSEMSSLLVSDSTDSGDLTHFNLDLDGTGLGEADIVDVVEAYPIHASEREFVKERGFKKFWGLGWDRFDPLRPPVV